MRLFKSLLRWMDKDWEARDYNPVHAYAQRLIWTAPFLAALLLVALFESIGFQRDSPVIVGSLILGSAGMFLMLGVSLYRWMAGYSRSDWQDRKAKEHRADIAARRNMSRSPSPETRTLPADQDD